MFMRFLTKNGIFFLVLLLVQTGLFAQEDSLDYGNERRLYFGIEAGGYKDFGKQANFFRGYSDFSIEDLLSIPQVYNELFSKYNYNYSMDEYPALMKYNFGISTGLKVLYKGDDINYTLSGHFSKLQTSGSFTLAAENPSNPSGDDIIKVQEITGVERRTWIKLGAQFKNEINSRNDFFFELGTLAIFQKAISNYAIIEGNRYSLLTNNLANLNIQTSYFGYGLNLGLGIQTIFLKNRLTQLGLNFQAAKLNMVKVKGLNYSGDLYLSVFL